MQDTRRCTGVELGGTGADGQAQYGVAWMDAQPDAGHVKESEGDEQIVHGPPELLQARVPPPTAVTLGSALQDN